MDELLLTLLVPPLVCSPNSRAHWAAKARATRQYREAVCVLAMAAANGRRPLWTIAKVSLSVYCRTRRRRDADNMLARCKPAFDGVQDAGIIADDRGLIHMPIRFGVDRLRPRVEMLIAPALDAGAVV